MNVEPTLTNYSLTSPSIDTNVILEGKKTCFVFLKPISLIEIHSFVHQTTYLMFLTIYCFPNNIHPQKRKGIRTTENKEQENKR